MSYRIGYLVGSLAKGSINRTLSKALIALAPDESRARPFAVRPCPCVNR